MLFSELNLSPSILKALEKEGYTRPTLIQEKSIPIILKGKDLIGCAQTGTGKTAAFALPIIQLLSEKVGQTPKKVKTLILTPTRELAIQIGENFTSYGVESNVRHAVIFGGVSQGAQVQALKRGVDVLIATPGRLLDLINQRFIHLNDLEIFVLDEADRMLDMGFIHDIRKVLTKLPAKRQSLFFSATMAPDIKVLAESILTDPSMVEVAPVSSTAETVEQSLYYVDKPDKKKLLIDLIQDMSIESGLVFTRTKHGADRLAKDLNRVGILSDAIHGNKSQNARQKALQNFKSNKISFLIATDIAARGIDIDKLPFVFNYDIPNEPESYVHRIGRTGRAGESGKAIAFCDNEERSYVRDIIKLIGKGIPVVSGHAYELAPQTNGSATAQGQEKNKPSGSAKRWSGNRNRSFQNKF
ncbi:MAG: DEAD/DEAH box helicase [Cytophagaceae bacterium]